MSRILWPNGTTTPPNFSAEGHFGYRKSTAPGASKYHRGLDMWGIGRICAIADGTVVAVGWGAGYSWGGGYQVWIQHDGFFTRSLHLMAYSSPLRVGDQVRAGDFIGREGRTGAYEVHLHLEITPGQWHAANTGQVDPKAWLYDHVGGQSAGTDQGGTPDDTDYAKELEMSAADDVKWIKDRIGGSLSREKNLTQEIDELARENAELRADVDWLKQRVGGSITRRTTLSQDVDAIKTKLKA
ncbi:MULTISPECIES: peptidoglycan DD-metalloendopeptidase family protein [unclassified Microbacterium]|uniref:peptidoglycan DD-metalloendopeptidase family protein n=1 Tax=Microbacterium TaxID=33882 RepID=UPI003BA0BBDD